MTRNIKNIFEINAASPEKRWFFFIQLNILNHHFQLYGVLGWGGGAHMENWGNVLHPESNIEDPTPSRNKRIWRK